MNFLVGHNGSESALVPRDEQHLSTGGKSAILTAIAVALGGKASNTGRGQGIKDLIRKGAE